MEVSDEAKLAFMKVFWELFNLNHELPIYQLRWAVQKECCKRFQWSASEFTAVKNAVVPPDETSTEVIEL